MEAKKKNLNAWTCRLTAVVGVGAFGLSLAGTAFACPNINAIGNFKVSNVVGASFSISPGSCGPDLICGGANAADDTPYVVTYKVDTADRNSSGGIPGVKEYCLYPDDPPGNPISATAVATGNGGAAWTASFAAAQGYFSFFPKGPGLGEPKNISLDAT